MKARLKPVVLLFSILLLGGCHKANTRLSDPELPTRFKLIEAGDSLESVYRTLGPPIVVDLNPDVSGDGAYRLQSLGSPALATLLEMSADTNKELYLLYSQPLEAGGIYISYEVAVRGGKVLKKPEPSYQD